MFVSILERYILIILIYLFKLSSIDAVYIIHMLQEKLFL